MFKYFEDIMDEREEVKVLHLNRNSCVVNVHHVSTGSDDKCLVPIKEIVRQAIFINTSSIIPFHNHPSGNLNASNEDIRVSKLVKKACSLLDISLLYSIILTRESYKSLKDDSLI